MNFVTELKKCFNKMDKQLSMHEKIELCHCETYRLFHYHFTLGMWIRNNILKEDAPLYQLYLDGGAMHKDDISSYIIALFRLYLRAKYIRK